MSSNTDNQVLPRQTISSISLSFNGYVEWQLSYPLRWIDSYCRYELDKITKTIPLVCEEQNPGDFPNNIVKVYYFKEGDNEEENWELLCLLDNNVIAFYEAGCDNTGFDCRGFMRLSLADTLQNMLDYELVPDAYERYIKFQNFYKEKALIILRYLRKAKWYRLWRLSKTKQFMEWWYSPDNGGGRIHKRKMSSFIEGLK